jgi:hypothetical protein
VHVPIWILVSVVTVAGFVQGSAGFGFGLFAMGALALVMPVTEAAVLVALLGLASIALNAWSTRKAMPLGELLPIVATAIPCTLVGVVLLKVLDARVLRGAVAVLIMLGCAVTVWTPRRARIERAWPWGYLSGALGGVLGGALNMGGPPVVVYTLLRRWDKGIAKGVMSGFFLVTSLVRVAGQVAAGLATRELAMWALLLVLPTLVASYAGVRLFRRLSNRGFRTLATIVLAGLAVRLLFA